jgi:glyoxylase-like metal-dependent hydrolase (beta-lactamase superfamily II)
VAKELVTLAPGVHYLPGGTNLGLLVNEERGTAVAVDAGMDKDSARGLAAAAAAAGLTIEALFLTHAHADHFGGAAYLRERTGAAVVAAGLEAAVVQNPILEPLYLFAGGMPPAALRGKFLLGQACPVDRVVAPGETVTLAGLECRVEPLPGHTPAQVGLGWGPVLFSGDAFFPEPILAKHPIPVFADPRAARATLARLPAGGFEWAIPGHGVPCRRGAELDLVCSANAAALDGLTDAVRQALGAGPLTLDDLLGVVAGLVGADLGTLADVCLARLTVQAVLGELCDDGGARAVCRGSRLVWEKQGPE